jgi:hypothetical protein
MKHLVITVFVFISYTGFAQLQSTSKVYLQFSET